MVSIQSSLPLQAIRSWLTNYQNTAVSLVATATLAALLGFAYGNYFDRQCSFDLKEWQTLVSAAVAFAAATVAYIGVRGTQRITVMIKEQDRIDDALPGLRQTRDRIDSLLAKVEWPRHLLHEAHHHIRSILRPQHGETYEACVARIIPLADQELRRDVTSAVSRLGTQASVLQARKGEIDQTEADLAGIAGFAPTFHQAVRNAALLARERYDQDATSFLSVVDTLRTLNATIEERLSRAQKRREIIERDRNRRYSRK
jgi:hypothetical protein